MEVWHYANRQVIACVFISITMPTTDIVRTFESFSASFAQVHTSMTSLRTVA